MTELEQHMRGFSRTRPRVGDRWALVSPHPCVRDAVRLFVRYAPVWL